jgi:hypothetical protein
MDKETMFNKIMPSFADHLQNQDSFSFRESGLNSDKSALFAGDPSLDQRSSMIYNIAERLVLKTVDEVILRFNCCRCDRCRRDIIAYALNLLSPKYIVADLQSVEKAEADYTRKPILDALIKACLKVRANPRH